MAGASLDAGAGGDVSAAGIAERFAELARVGGADDVDLLPSRLCRVAVDVLPVDGAGISVLTGPEISVPLGASDELAAEAERLQFTLGEGPCLQTSSVGRPVLVPDLTDQSAQGWNDWPTYATELTRRLPYRAVFCFPVPAAGLRLSSITLYRNAADGLAPDHLALMRTVVERVAAALGGPLALLGSEGEPTARFVDAPTARARRQVWVAEGMSMAEHGWSPQEALASLRAYAFLHDRTVDDVAADIVDGLLSAAALRTD